MTIISPRGHREPRRGGNGLGFGTILFLIFLVLKLGVGDTTVQSWSWWWVFAPLWIPVAILLVIGLITVIAKAASR